MQHNSTDTTQQLDNGSSQHSATQHNKTDTTQRNRTDRNTMQRNATQQTQHNKTGNKNYAHMLNKPVEVINVELDQKLHRRKNGQKRCRYIPKCPSTIIIDGNR